MGIFKKDRRDIKEKNELMHGGLVMRNKDLESYYNISIKELMDKNNTNVMENLEDISVSEMPVHNHETKFKYLREFKSKFPDVKRVVWGYYPKNRDRSSYLPYDEENIVDHMGDSDCEKNTCLQNIIFSNEYIDLWKVCYLDINLLNYTTFEGRKIEINDKIMGLGVYLLDGRTYDEAMWYISIMELDTEYEIEKAGEKFGGYVVIPKTIENVNLYLMGAIKKSIEDIIKNKNILNTYDANLSNIDAIFKDANFKKIISYTQSKQLVNTDDVSYYAGKIKDLELNNNAESILKISKEELLLNSILHTAMYYNDIQRKEVKQLVFEINRFFEEEEYSECLQRECIDSIFLNNEFNSVLAIYPNLSEVWCIDKNEEDVYWLLKKENGNDEVPVFKSNKFINKWRKGWSAPFLLSADMIVSLDNGMKCVATYSCNPIGYERVTGSDYVQRIFASVNIKVFHDDGGHLKASIFGIENSYIYYVYNGNFEEYINILAKMLEEELFLNKAFAPDNLVDLLMYEEALKDKLIKQIHLYNAIVNLRTELRYEEVDNKEIIKIEVVDSNFHLGISVGDMVDIISEEFNNLDLGSDLNKRIFSATMKVVKVGERDIVLLRKNEGEPSIQLVNLPIGLVVMVSSKDQKYGYRIESALYRII